jgi:hypothetical protein
LHELETGLSGNTQVEDEIDQYDYPDVVGKADRLDLNFIPLEFVTRKKLTTT